MANLASRALRLADPMAGVIPFSSKLGMAISSVAGNQQAAGRSVRGAIDVLPSRPASPSLLARAGRSGAKQPPVLPSQLTPANSTALPRSSRLMGRPRPQTPARIAMGGAALPFSPPPIATPAPSGLAYKRNMGPLNMPRPSIGKPISAAGVPTLGANSGLGSIALAGALGGIIGGYSSGDMWGAAKGAFGGAFLGAIAGGGIPYAYKYGADMALSVKGVSQYSDSIVRVGQTLNTADSRRALFAAGGMLGGVAFGGSRNSRRGFNKDRGSRIGR